MSERQLSSYLPGKHLETKAVQAKVSKELFERAEAILRARKNTWVEFIEASMLKLIDENPTKKLK